MIERVIPTKIVCLRHYCGQPCEGEVELLDWGNSVRWAMRYETSCARCGDCDPNGYASQKQAIAAAKSYFDPNRNEKP